MLKFRAVGLGAVHACRCRKQGRSGPLLIIKFCALHRKCKNCCRATHGVEAISRHDVESARRFGKQRQGSVGGFCFVTADLVRLLLDRAGLDVPAAAGASQADS